MSETLALRGRVASLSRSRSANDPDLIEARRALAAEKLAAYVSKTVAEAPPLTPAQRDRIASLLRPTKARDAQ
ncbi:hypothetical protein [Micrococcus luteus]|uniref:hypothetical protein n=1 Tax=Micrococcus luteus TaxID=1270 RepID=UPI00044F8994|nr:hypothetical protein [Micrococcus luteus]EZP62318.1 hypothetical protein BW40_00346 [Micrococcus luteus]